MNGAQQIEQMRGAGFSGDEIDAWATRQRSQLSSAGFAQADVDAYFGVKEPNLEPIRALVKKNLMAQGAGEGDADAYGQMAQKGLEATDAAVSAAVQPEQSPDERAAVRKLVDQGAASKVLGAKPARTFDQALEAGLQISVSGLMARGAAPNRVLAEDAPMASRIAANVATVVGDLPWMAAGAVLGGGAGAPTGPGAVVTGAAGAFGLPAGLRATLMDSYTKGEFTSFKDFWERSSGIIWETVKGEITGAATAASGGAASAATAAAPLVVRALAPTAAEIATMTTVGKALEGQVPNAQDFLDAAVVLGGMKGAMGAARGAKALETKLRDVYAKTGVAPREVMEQAAKDPTVVQDLVAENREVPEGLRPLADPEMEAAAGGSAVAPAPRAPAVEEPPEPTPQSAVLDRISVGDRQPRGYDFDKFYTDMKDELFPLRRVTDELAGGEKLEVADDPYRLARLTRGAAGKADQFLLHAPFDFKTYESVGKGLREIIEPVKDDLDGLRAYAVARRTVELEKRGIETGVPVDEAKEVVRGGGKYEQPFADLLEYQEHLVRYLTDSGVLSKDAATAMREANRDYVPFFRLMGDEKGGSAGAGPGMSVRSPIKGIKGSERKIVDPLESIIKNTYLYTALAERNAVGQALVKLAEKSGRDDLVQKVAGASKPIEVQAKEVQDFLDAHGIEGDGEAFSVFRRGFMNPGSDEIVVFRDGKREIYQVPEPVAAAFKATDRESAGMLTRILAIPAKTLRAGATLAPDFVLRNLIRDQTSAFIFSKNSYLPLVDFMRGFVSVAKQDDAFQAWLKSGGANATMISMDRQYLQQRLSELSDLQSVRDKVWNAVKLPIEMLRVASELVENATRVGEFKRAAGGDFSKESAQSAGFESREVTLDFARIGAKTRSVNMITAFWNAQVEGLDRTARAFKDEPFGTTARVAASITLPSLMLWWANHDDPRWKEIPQWERDLFWVVLTKDHIYRIPKPFELGLIFGSIPERMLDAFYDQQPDAFKKLGASMVKVFGFGVIPTAAAPVLEHMTNYSFFTDRPLIPSNLEKLLPEYQYTPYTNEATKALGQMIGTIPGAHDASAASPMIIENYVRGWTGTMGIYAVQVADAALRKAGVLPDPVKPAATLADIPVIKAFVVRYPSSQAQSIQDFNDHYKQAKQVADTVQYLARQGDADAAMKEAMLDPMALLKLDGIHDALGNAQRVIQLVDRNPTFSADEKRQLIDSTYFQMIDMAREGEKALREMKRSLGPRFEKKHEPVALAPEALAIP